MLWKKLRLQFIAISKSKIFVPCLVSPVPAEPRWSSPIRKHISCPTDASSTSNTIALAYLVSDISDIYENFVMKIITEMLIEGPNAPFYRSLIEAGLGTGFSPSSGF